MTTHAIAVNMSVSVIGIYSVDRPALSYPKQENKPV